MLLAKSPTRLPVCLHYLLETRRSSCSMLTDTVVGTTKFSGFEPMHLVWSFAFSFFCESLFLKLVSSENGVYYILKDIYYNQIFRSVLPYTIFKRAEISSFTAVYHSTNPDSWIANESPYLCTSRMLNLIWILNWEDHVGWLHIITRSEYFYCVGMALTIYPYTQC